MERETRFTHEILLEALERLNEIKERIEEAEGADGIALLAEMGFAPMSAYELATEEISTSESLAEDDPRLNEENRIALAYWNGLMMGAIAADISWEHSFGLSGTPSC